MSRHTLMMTMAAIVLTVSILIGASLACDTCPERGECNGTNTYCSGCDPDGWTTCSDFSYKIYGGPVHDCKPDPEGASGLTCTDKTDVTCYHEADCVEGSWLYGFHCQNGSCTEVWAPLSWCQLCIMTNLNTVKKYDWTCE